MEEKNVITLYGMMLKDSQFQKTSNIKIAEIKENARIVAGLTKMKAEQVKRQEIENQTAGKAPESELHAAADRKTSSLLRHPSYRRYQVYGTTP